MPVYYKGDPFDFHRFPNLLLYADEYKELSINAKVIYMVCLQRVGLSRESGRIDKNGKYFIYLTVDNIKEIFNCSNKTAIKVLNELDDKNEIGFIERKRQGLGHPNRIYVRDFRYRQK